MGQTSHEARPALASAQGDRDFASLVERYRARLHLHCYRMVGSLEDAEDLVQETILRAWRYRQGFEGRSTVHTWLYRIATNVCLDFLERRRPRDMPPQLALAIEPGEAPPPASDLVWLDPYPERLLASIASEDDDPEIAVASKETVELAFLAAIQHLPARRRAVLILRDVLGWSAKETASALGLTVPSVNSASQRARTTMRQHLPRRRVEWSPAANPSRAELALLRSYMDAHERGDVDALARLLRDDVRLSAPPLPRHRDGRDAFLAAVRRSAVPGRFRYVPTRANGQPAAASYVRRDGDRAHRPLAIDVLRIEGGLVAEVSVFLRADLFPAFGLPSTL
jgi:RNA polymerase sigma-70 factor (ECF subfamily)